MVLSRIRTTQGGGVIKPIAVLRLVSLVALGLPLLAQAAGLGRLSVQSFLGQPLRAEIEVVSVLPGEEASLEARLATANAFKQAGIEFSPALAGVRFTMDKVGGRPVLRVTTRQPVNDPFLDILVELRWATGLLVREYTILLDPPDYVAQPPAAVAAAPAPAAPIAVPAPAPVAPIAAAPAAPSAEARPPAAPAAPVSPPSAAPAPTEAPAAPIAEAAKPEARIEERPIAAAPAPVQPEAKPGLLAETYEVKKGDTLGRIALQYKPEGVTFNQMLIALQRANEDAFIRNNVNLVRAGKILNIPERDAIVAIEPDDAKRLIGAQMADFAEYRSRMAATVAAAPAAPAPAESAAAGQIKPRPEEPKPAEAKDQLKLSRADAKKPGAPVARAAREDDLAARERALKEAQSRVTDLEKNVADLQKLMEIKNQQLAELEKKAGAKPAPATAAKAAEPPKPAPAPQAAKAPEAKPAAPAPAKAPAELAKPVAEATKPAVEAAAPVAAAPKPAAEAPKPAAKPAPAKPKPAAAPPPPEPSLVDEFLDNPIALGGLGGVLLLLIGYGAWAWQRKKKSVSKFQDSVMGAAGAPAAAAAVSAPPVSGPASVSQTSVSQSAVGGMGTDDVDPIAEADVYMAYGRDAQAEEILKEALQKDANRIPVHVKLLEIYASRRDARSFEQSALKLKNLTNGAGPDWEKAAALGRTIDAGNGLYGGTGAQAAAAPAAPAAPAPAPSVDFDIGSQPAGGEAQSAPMPTLDLDLGGASVPSGEKSDFSPGGTLIIDAQETKAASSGLDFDLGTTGTGKKAADTTTALSFELPATAEATAPAASAPATSAGGLDFDLNLGGGEAKAEAKTEAPAMDLAAISLDLGTPGEAAAAAPGADPKWQEVATKLDLAKAYEEMGDKDGARELLNEVVREGDTAQQGQAKQMLAKLG
jgi:pilus assembly protein FimV